MLISEAKQAEHTLHPDAGASPGEYASDEEWEAFRARESNRIV